MDGRYAASRSSSVIDGTGRSRRAVADAVDGVDDHPFDVVSIGAVRKEHHPDRPS